MSFEQVFKLANYTLSQHKLFVARPLTHLPVLMPQIIRDHLFCTMARDRFNAAIVEWKTSVMCDEKQQITDIPSSPGSCSITKWISRGRFTFAHITHASLEHKPSGRKATTSCSQDAVFSTTRSER